MKWIYKEKEFDGELGEYIGFVYLITNTCSGRMYIGKKNFYQFRTPKGGKRKVKSESNWANYYSSSDDLKADVKTLGKSNFTREILVLCESKRQQTYVETALQFKLDVLKDELYYNVNIGGKFYHHFDC